MEAGRKGERESRRARGRADIDLPRDTAPRLACVVWQPQLPIFPSPPHPDVPRDGEGYGVRVAARYLGHALRVATRYSVSRCARRCGMWDWM